MVATDNAIEGFSKVSEYEKIPMRRISEGKFFFWNLMWTESFGNLICWFFLTYINLIDGEFGRSSNLGKVLSTYLLTYHR